MPKRSMRSGRARPPKDTFRSTERCGKEGVLLEDVAHRTILGSPVAAAVEPELAVHLDPSATGPSEPCEGTKHGRLARPGGPDERNGLAPDLERYLDVEVANGDREIESKRAHVKTFSPTRMAAPATTKSALIASATSRSWSS